jgi:LuxR family maltose regulon positive regulatory protein
MVSRLPNSVKSPRSSGMINRPRLLEKLEGAWEYRLTLISAPPGYGKSTLIGQFASQQTAPVIWHSIEERERDVPYLYTHCLTALEAVVPGIKLLVSPYGYGAGDLAALIADYLRDHLRQDIIYVLDDVQLLAGAPAAESWLRAVVALFPAACHLILASRILPDLPLADMVARREILAIGQEDLRRNLVAWLSDIRQYTTRQPHRGTGDAA